MKSGVNKKGLSTIVSTLLIILLVFVAIGILWVVVKNLVTSGSNQLELSSNCIEISVSPLKVVSSGSVYNVTIVRETTTGSGTEIGGVKLIFSSSTSDSNYIEDVPGNLAPLVSTTVPVTVTDFVPEKVEVVVYFLDSSGVEQFCSNSNDLVF